MMRIAAIVMGLALLVMLLATCQGRPGHPWRDPERSPPVIPPAPGPAPTPVATVADALAAFSAEPVIGVLLHSAARCDLILLQTGRSPVGILPDGTWTISAGPRGLVLPGLPVVDSLDLRFTAGAGQATFALETSGPGRRRYGGDLRLLWDQAEGLVRVIEIIPLERYLPGVLVSEMGPGWPAAALEAQAIAARSFALSRIAARSGRPWQLDARYEVDMAYPGLVTDQAPAAVAAVQATSGRVLATRSARILPAFFHASSGGRSESVANRWPQTGPGHGGEPYLTVIDDPFAALGAEGLRRPDADRWQHSMPLTEVAASLTQAITAAGGPPGRRITAVRIVDRFADSHRVRSVGLRLEGHADEVLLPATVIRQAIGGTLLRSTWWEACLVVGDRLIIHGRGYGHGVGLSQVSAWAMAQRGLDADTILRFFYRGADIRGLW